MTFLNAYLLWGLLLAAIPILIHLINQRRHRTVEWGAMMFLLSAKKMSRGMALLKQILIMAARMLAIVGLILAIGRPLATGWFGALTGGKPETVIVILDRSSSMKQQQLSTGESKLDSGLVKIANMISTYGSNMDIVLIESTSNRPVRVTSPAALLDYPKTFATDSSADVPGMVQTALDFVSDNQTGRTDIWICSDARQNDWDPESSRWGSLKSGFAEYSGVRFHVLNYAEEAEENYSVIVNRSERVSTKTGPELELDLLVRRKSESQAKETLRLNFTINGVQTALDVEIENEEYALTGHRIPLDAGVESGWGMIELLTADANENDNRHFFSFAQQPIFETVIVSDNPRAVRALKYASEKGMDPSRLYKATVVGSDQLGEINWNQTALLLWQAPLPQDIEAKQIDSFVDNGRSVIFFPPDEADDSEYDGVSWGDWERMAADKQQSVKDWQEDDDLLRNTRNGDALGLNELQVYRYCSLNGDGRTLAVLQNDSALLKRKSTDNGGVYFFSTLPGGSHSSLEREGVILFAMIQRALANGGSSIGKAKQLIAGTKPAQVVTDLKPLSDDTVELIESRPYSAGVYGTEDLIVALNRPRVEDTAKAIPRPEIEELLAGLDFHIIEDELGSTKSLASEAWKAFIVLMGLALLAEAIFCLPPKPEQDTVELGGIRA